MTAHDLNSALRDLAPALANHLWQSTAFVAAAGLLTLALRSNRAHTRHWIWMAASLKFLLPFAMLAGIAGHFARPRVVAPANPAVYSAVEDFSEPFADFGEPVAAPVIMRPHVSAGEWLPIACAAVWLTGLFAALIVWTVGWRQVAGTVRAGEPMPEGREVAILRRLEQAASVRRPMRLVLSESAMEPGVFGIVRSVLAWPAGISERLDDAHMETVLAHEVCHVRRWDNLTAMLHMFVEAAFWFHPLVWWMGARLVAERERACDEEVLQLLNRPQVYAESILKVCEFCVESPLECVAGVTGADLKKRIVEIMRARAVMRLTWGKKLLIGAATVCAIAVPVVLGQAKAAQRMMLAAIKDAPKPIQFVAHAMIADAKSSSSEIADASQAATPPDNAAPTADDMSLGPAFEVATIRPGSMNDGRRSFGSTVDASGKFTGSDVRLSSLVSLAYAGDPSKVRVSGGPKWAESDLFDINAKIDDAYMSGWDKLSYRERVDRMRPMIRTLLAQRFQLKLHVEMQPTPVYALVQAKGGSKLKEVPAPEASDNDPQAAMRWMDQNPGKPRPGSIFCTGNTCTGTAIRVSEAINQIAGSAHADRKVIDATGLKGYYNFTMTQPQHDDQDAMAEVADDLGLKFEPRTVPVKTFVIDSAEKPSVDGAEVTAAASVVPVAMVQEKVGAASATDSTQPSAYLPKMTFDVASVRESKQDPNQPHTVGGRFEPHSTNLRLQNVQMYYMVTMAYGISIHEIEGLPDWGWTSFNIEAKSDSAADDRLAKLDKKSAELEQEHMLQALLAERFHLRVHWTTEEGPIYDLVLAKVGSKLLPAGSMAPPPEEQKWLHGEDVPPLHQQGDGRLGYEFFGHSCPIEDLVRILGAMMGRNVVDQTGLTGNFDFRLQYHHDRTDDDAERGSGMDDPEVWPPITVAVQDQLGLKLVPAKGQLRKLVIDHVEMPSAN